MDTAPSTNVIGTLRTELASTLASADNNATQRVQNLKLVQQARLSGLSRTAAALKAQYGPDNAQVKTAEAAVAATTTTVARVSIMHQQLTTPVPQVAKQGWALHGRVFSAQLQPVSGFTVFLVNAEKTYQQLYGFAYTDETGYFVLSYAGTQGQSPTPSAQQLFLEIADAKGRPVYLSTTPFQPATESVTYQNVVLPSGEQPIGDPPQSIRNIAIPGKGA
jgi:hypothetical protein